MRFIESNYRYTLFSAGYKFIIEFNSRTAKDRDLFLKFSNAFKQQYGAIREELPQQPGELLPRYRYNDNWRTDYDQRLKRRRIYFKVESDYTMMTLRIQ